MRGGGLKRNQFFVKAPRMNPNYDVDGLPRDFSDNKFPYTTFDTQVSAIFSDLFNGKSEQVTIQGGIDNLLYITEHKIPDAPPFGDAKLVGLKHYLYIPKGGLNLEPANTINPARLIAWKVNRSMGPNEGNMIEDITAGDTAENSLAIFNSTRNSKSTGIMSENFNPTGNDLVTISNSGFLPSDVYVPINAELLEMDASKDAAYLRSSSIDKFREWYGTDHPELGWIIYVRIDNKAWYNVWRHFVDIVSTPNQYAGMNPKWEPIEDRSRWGYSDRPSWRHNDLMALGLLKVKAPLGTDPGENIAVTENDSIFIDVHTRCSGIDTDVGEVMATATYDSKTSLSGSSMKMYCNWESGFGGGDGNNTAGPLLWAFQREDPQGSDATQRQEVVATLEIPAPLNIGDTVPAHGDAVNVDWSGEPFATPMGRYSAKTTKIIHPKISTDINIASLARTYNIGYKAEDNDGETDKLNPHTFARSFVITFSNNAPKTNQTFYDFCVSYSQRKGYSDHMFAGICFMNYSLAENGTNFNVAESEIDQRKDFNGDNPNFATEGIMAVPFGVGQHDEWITSLADASADLPHGRNNSGWSTNKVWHVTDVSDAADISMVWANSDRFRANAGVRVTNFYHNVPEQKWLNLTFQMDASNDDSIYLRIKESGSNELIATHRLPILGKDGDYPVWPQYMTFWLLNFPDKQGGNGEDGDNDNADIVKRYPNCQSYGLPGGANISSTVYIDNITMTHFNRSITNMSANSNNFTSRGSFSLSSGDELNFYAGTENQVMDDVEIDCATFLAIGFETQSDFDQAEANGPRTGRGTHLLFNAYSSSGATTPQIGVTTPNKYIYLGYTADNQSGKAGATQTEVLGNADLTQNDTQEYYGTFFNRDSESKDSHGKGLSVTGSLDASDEDNCGVNMDGNRVFSVDNLSQQGVMNLQFNSNNSGGHTPNKRECIWASARMLDIIDKHTFTVDNPSIFNLPDDTEYIIYKKNSDWEGDGKYYSTVKLDGRPDGNIIKVDKDIRARENESSAPPNEHHWLVRQRGKLGLSLLTGTTISRIFISPKKYWLVYMMHPYDGDGELMPTKNYSSICTVNKVNNNDILDLEAKDEGASFNEFKFTDGAYVRSWGLVPSKISDIEVETDFGNGAWDEETSFGGFINSTYINRDELWHGFDLSPLIESDTELKEEDTVTILYSPYEGIQRTQFKIESLQSRNVPDGSSLTGYYAPIRPLYLAIYEDKVPEISDFTVAPSETNPSLAQFNWSVDDSDIWYGFLIADDEPIYHQYHKAEFHAPCNTPNTTSDNPDCLFGNANSDREEWFNYNADKSGKFLGNNYIGNATDTVLDNNLFLQPNGIAGWAYDFKMHKLSYPIGDYLALEHTTQETPFTESVNRINLPTTNMSFIAHITPASIYREDGWSKEELEEDVDTIFTASGDIGNDITRSFKIYLDRTLKRIIAEARPVNGDPCTLMSRSFIPTDDLTPTCVIATLDTTLTSGNFKLFINGKLEDLSGKVTTEGGKDNWKRGAQLDSNTTSVSDFSMIGANYNKVGTYSKDIKEGYAGKIEELVYYPITIYPVNVASNSYTLSKPMSELYSNLEGESKTISARLFVKDYHNIRGKTVKHIGMSPEVHIRKAAPILDGRTD